MTTLGEVRLGRAFFASAAASVLLIGGGLLLETRSWIVAGILLAALVAWGARAPRRIRVSYTQAVSHRSPAEGQAVRVEAELGNPSWRPALVEWRLRLPGLCEVASGSSAGWAAIRPRSSSPIRAEARFLLFGLQRMGPLHVRSGDVFGLAASEATIGDPAELRVRPQSPSLRDTVARARQLRALFGAYEVPRPGHGFEFFGLRDYVVGDRPRDINWKASARHRTLIVNQHEKENDLEVAVILDARAASFVGRQTMSPFAQAGRAALALSEAHLHARDAVRFIAYGRSVHRDRHTGAVRHLQGILDLLVGLEPEGDLPLQEVVDGVLSWLKPRSPVILFSSLSEDPTIEASLARLHGADLAVHVVVPRPDWGDAAALPECRAWDAAQRQVVRRVRQMGFPVAEISPGQPLDEALGRLEAVA